MSVTTSYPGIYIQELPSSSHTILPAPTSIAAFVGYSHPFKTLNFNAVQQLFSFNDYETYFGPLFSSGLVDASLPRAVYQFFLNGGSTAYVVGLQPGLFDTADALVTRLGAANGGATISAGTSGGTSAALGFAVNAANPVPTITALAPAGITAGEPGFTLTVTGRNFTAGSTVNWNGTPLTPATATPTALTVAVPASDIAAAGSANVTVINPAPGGGTSAPLVFAISANHPVPAITALAPASVTAGGVAFTLTVTGTGFVSASRVDLNGTALTTTFVSPTELTAAVPAADIAAVGTPSITVVNPGPGGGTSAGVALTVTATNPAPTITSLTPATATAGGPAFTLTVWGSNFVPASVVSWAGGALTTTYVSALQLTAAVPASAVATAGTASVTVSTPAPGGGTSAGFSFAIASSNPVPMIASLSPASVIAGAAAFTLTVNGSNFVPASVVNWNGAPLTTTFVSATQLTAAVPAANVAAAATPSVTVVNPSNNVGLVFTARELTDIVPMTVTIANVRAGGTVFDVVVTYATQVETYRAVQLGGPAARLPDAVINPASALVQVAPASAGYGTTIAAQQLAIGYAVAATASTSFNAADFTVGDGSALSVFEANSPLDNIEIFNLLMVPGVTDFSVVSAALSFAERKRAFVILDPPPQSPAFGSSVATPQPIEYWMLGLYSPTGPALPLSQNGAIYFPYLSSNDPVTGNNIPMAPSGFVAGIYAQTDTNRGVWKAPAGLAAIVNNTVGPVLSGVMNDPQQGVLNLDSINCLRSFSGSGTVVWGARTLVAGNTAYQQSRYVPVRRMTLFIEQTLLANLRWVVFEPNDTPLWTAIKSTIEAFLLSLFRQGALQGSQPSDAFQVKCDATTTSPDDQQNGVVNIVVAFAPLKPAEFVVIKIAQLAGQTAGT